MKDDVPQFFSFRPRLVDTLKHYTRQDATADLTAGLTVGIVALPLAMAFAIASGVEPKAGLWTAIIAGFIISALGGSRVQIGGPTGAFVGIVYAIIAQYGVQNLVICTVMAGEMLVMKLIYMDAASGAKKAIGEEMIAAVGKHIEVPLVVGGGIRTAEKAYLNCKAGADVIVVGNAIEKDASLITEIAAAIHSVPVRIA